jgi:signal transduction histidine kinase
MHARVRAHDWASTPLGPVETWPRSLTSVVKTLLASRYPMVLTWGPHLIQFYNDAYSKLIGDKHPAALGIDIRITLEEGWETLGPLIAEVMRTGVANWNPALLLVLERSGYREEAYFNVSHAPSEDDDGAIVGMLAVCSEVTQEVLGERRLRLLRDLAFRTGEARSVETTCRNISACMAEHPLDLPFALLYLREGEQLILRGAVGLEPGGPATPHIVDLTAGGDEAWPFAQTVAGETTLIGDVQRRVAACGGPWNEPVHSALALPIVAPGQRSARGVLIVGVSPNRALDESYRSFYELLGGQISSAVRNAQAHQEERERIEMLAQLDRAKTEFFSNVSHEFRTPLTLMLGPLEELLAEAPGLLRAEDRENVRIAHRNALRLLKLVNTLLDFSRIEADRAQAFYAPVDLATLTTDLTSQFRSAFEKAGLDLVVDCPPLPEPIYVDREMWEKIVLNLLSNAFKFTRAGRVTVRQHVVDGQVELSVADTGSGIPAAELSNVFKRFHRIAGTDSRTYEGSGIGLALVRELVQLHGGAIRVESRHGQGSTFTVTIPTGSAHLPEEQISSGSASVDSRVDAFVEEALRWLPDDPITTDAAARWPQIAADEAERDGAARARILLADDNADMREYVRRLLSPRFDVIATADGAAALAAAREQLPDVVLSDVMMPKLDGFGLLAQLRADPRTSVIPVILLSARAGEEASAAGIETGADDYLIKPFDARELLARITTHLDLTRMRREAATERERRSAAEALVRERDQFLSLAAHELKTPLTSIRGYLDLFIRRTVREGSLNPRDQRAVQVISQQIERLNALVMTLLDLTRLEMGQFVQQRRTMDLGALVRRVGDDIQLTLKRHTLELELADEPLLVDGDELRLEQVLQNLVENAIKYSPLGGPITVAARRRGDEVCLAVRDQGIGIPELEREHIFERFYRADNASQQQIGGLGIGLYVVKEIVTQHGGSIDVVSQQDAGSAFTICLPAHRS